MDPISQNVEGVRQLVTSGLNKVPEGVLEDNEGPASEKLDLLDLPMADADLLSLRDKWESRYVGYEANITPKQKKNKSYYKGAQAEGTPWVAEDPVAANIQWEAAETFYAAALAKNPSPVVYCDNTPEGNKLAGDVRTMLEYHADQLMLRRLLMLQTRKWSIDQLGVLKHGWDAETNEIVTDVRGAKNFIFDPDGFVDQFGHFSSYLGERIDVTADRLTELFPKKKAEIILSVGEKMGTMCTYTEWWNDDYTFCTYKSIVLDKSKNPHFNYEEAPQGLTGPLPANISGVNHFAKPLKPYTFLSV